jgi:ABC-type phosphate transport system permease subunit
MWFVNSLIAMFIFFGLNIAYSSNPKFKEKLKREILKIDPKKDVTEEGLNKTILGTSIVCAIVAYFIWPFLLGLGLYLFISSKIER